MSSSTDMLFAFNREKAKGQEWIQFNLSEFAMNVGDQRFRTKDLEALPEIKTKEIV